MKSTNRKKFTYILTLFVLASVFLTQCTPEKKYNILSFFFDEVPNPNAKTEVVVSTSDSVGLIVSQSLRPESYSHKPYGEENCKACHEGSFSNRLLKPLPELCYTCHEDFGSKYNYLHGPIASGNCIACHDQHEAKFEKLLKRESQDLCIYCHETKQVLKNKVHLKMGSATCTDCHNPHGGDGRGMINQGACFKCHTNFKTKYNFIHGPVVSNNCGSCHGSHSSGIPKLLLRESQQLCLTCHNSNDVFGSPAHKKIKTKNCTDCHNPHGGEDRFILVESLRPYKTKPSLNTSNDLVADTARKVENTPVDTAKAPIVLPANQKSELPAPAVDTTTKAKATETSPSGANKQTKETTTKTTSGSKTNAKAKQTEKPVNNTSDKPAELKEEHPFVTSNKANNDSLPVHNFLFLLKQFMDSNTLNPIPYAPAIAPGKESNSINKEVKDSTKVNKTTDSK